MEDSIRNPSRCSYLMARIMRVGSSTDAAFVEDADQAVFHILPTSEPVQERSRVWEG